MNNRIDYIDIAKGIGILLVLLGHMVPVGEDLRAMIYSFHMPLFFLLFGCVMKGDRPHVCAPKRWRQIAVPYLLWGMIFVAPTPRNALLVLYGTQESLTLAHGNGMLWFLVVMFFASIYASAFHLMLGKRGILVKVLTIIGLIALSWALNMLKTHTPTITRFGLPWAIDVTVLAMAFMLTGRWTIGALQALTARMNRWWLLVCGLLLTTLSVLGCYYPVEGTPSMAHYAVGNVWVFYAVAVVVSAGVVMISKVLSDSKLSGGGISRADLSGAGKTPWRCSSLTACSCWSTSCAISTLRTTRHNTSSRYTSYASYGQ